MEKQSYLPIKFYHRSGVQDYEKIKRYEGVAVPKYPSIAFPGFQLVLPDTVQGTSLATWDVDEFRVFLVHYESGTEWNVITNDIKAPVLYDADTFWVYVLDTFPWESVPASIDDYLGKFYYRVDYGEESDEIEISWESEIFDICDLDLDAMTEEFTVSSFDSFSSTYNGAFGQEFTEVEFCNLAGAATAVMPIECFPGEEFDVYIRTLDHDGTPACAATQWDNEITLQIVGDDSGRVWSAPITIDTTGTQYYTRLAVAGGAGAVTGELLLRMSATDATKGKFEIWVQRTWKAGHIQLAYSNELNFCKIVYEDSYYSRFFLNSKQVIDNKQLEETTTEDDEANKYRITGTMQSYHSASFAGGEYLLNAMSLLRLHDDITIVTETGEPMDVVELLIEQSVLDYEAVLIKLVYREDSCSWTKCEFSTA